MMTYFWYDDQGWWYGDPDDIGVGPYETFEQMMYAYQRTRGSST